MAKIHGDVGLAAYGATDTVREQKVDRLGGGLISHAAARYANLAQSGNLFTAHNVAAQAVSVALATTYTGLVISNPIGSGKNLVMVGAGFALSVAPAAIASLHLLNGFSGTTNVTHTTPLAAPGIQNALIGLGNAPTAKADSAATIPTPGYGLPLMGGFTAAALPGSTKVWLDLAGLQVIPPGGFIAIGALTAVTGFGAFAWYEQ